MIDYCFVLNHDLVLQYQVKLKKFKMHAFLSISVSYSKNVPNYLLAKNFKVR